jgi:hypothetical protein
MIAPNLLGVKPLDMGPRARCSHTLAFGDCRTTEPRRVVMGLPGGCSPFPVPFVGDTKASDLGSGPRQPVGLFRLATG